MRKKKVKIKGTLSKEENKRIEKLLKKHGAWRGGTAFKYNNTEKTYLYE